MLRVIKLGIVFVATLSALVPATRAQVPTRTAVAPVPAQIIAAKKVFISNGGVDTAVLAATKRAGEPDQGYNQFYAAMKAWGRYELAATPADADLVFEIRFAAPTSDCQKVTTYEPQFGLTIMDAKTHFTLWTLTEPVQGAFRKATWNRNVNQGVADLIDDIRQLAGPSVATAVGADRN